MYLHAWFLLTTCSIDAKKRDENLALKTLYSYVPKIWSTICGASQLNCFQLSLQSNLLGKIRPTRRRVRKLARKRACWWLCKESKRPECACDACDNWFSLLKKSIPTYRNLFISAGNSTHYTHYQLGHFKHGEYRQCLIEFNHGIGSDVNLDLWPHKDSRVFWKGNWV